MKRPKRGSWEPLLREFCKNWTKLLDIVELSNRVAATGSEKSKLRVHHQGI